MEEVAEQLQNGGGGGDNVEVPIIQERENPLLNSVIMTQVFKVMENTVAVKDLKNFRLVCKLWNENSLKVWRKVAPLRLGPPAPEKVATRSESRSPPARYLPVNTFLEMVSGARQDTLLLQRFPFRNFVLTQINFSGAIPGPLMLSPAGGQEDGNLWSYLNRMEGHLGSFGFDSCRISAGGTGVQFCDNMIATKLNRFRKVTFTNNETPASCLSSHMLTVVNGNGYRPRNPSVKILEVRGPGYTLSDPFLMLLDCATLEELLIKGNYTLNLADLFKALRRRQAKFPELRSKLKKLDALESDFFDLSGFEYPPSMLELNFQWEHLSLSLKKHHCDKGDRFQEVQDLISPILGKCRRSLKVLKLFRAPLFRSTGMNSPFPCTMGSLKELHLLGNLITNLCFLCLLPNLKVLHIDFKCLGMKEHIKSLYKTGSEPEKWNELLRNYTPYWTDLLLSPNLRPNVTLKHLSSVTLKCKVEPATVRYFSEWMPSLKSFKAIMDNEQVWEMVCKWMPGLEEVGILKGSRVGEGDITGFKSSEPDSSRNERNISCFKNLSRFEYLSYCGESSLGDSVVYQGLLQIEKLVEVYICVNEHFSLEAENALNKKVLLTTVIRNTDAGCQGNWNCCEEGLFLRELNG